MDLLLPHVVPFLMVVFRLAGLFLLAPLLTSTMVPMTVRALLVFILALLLYPTLPAAARPAVPLETFTLLPAVIGELLIGGVIGLVALIPVAAVQLSGSIIGQQMGFGLAQVYNPALESDADVLGQTLQYLALAAFLFMGGLEILFLCVAHTFDHVPLGGFSRTMVPVDLILGVLGSGFDLALRVTTPVLALMFFETALTAFVTKTMPQINIMSIGFAVKIVLAFLAIVVGLRAMNTAISDHVSQVTHWLTNWSTRVGAT